MLIDTDWEKIHKKLTFQNYSSIFRAPLKKPPPLPSKSNTLFPRSDLFFTTLLLRCVHTMPRGKMQYTAALPHGKSCSAYAANAITSTWKKNFLQTFFRLQKLWNETGEICLIFFSNWLIPFLNPYSSYAARLPLMGPIICRSNF